jgi:predicted nucleotidyltransferase
MPVRLLKSSVLKWPDAEKVDAAVRRWARKVGQQRPDVLQIGYFGSYARGDWGVGSDLDLVIILKSSEKTFDMRASEWDTREIPVPTDVLVYTREEWQARPGFLSPRLTAQIVWVPLS